MARKKKLLQNEKQDNTFEKLCQLFMKSEFSKYYKNFVPFESNSKWKGPDLVRKPTTDDTFHDVLFWKHYEKVQSLDVVKAQIVRDLVQLFFHKMYFESAIFLVNLSIPDKDHAYLASEIEALLNEKLSTPQYSSVSGRAFDISQLKIYDLDQILNASVSKAVKHPVESLTQEEAKTGKTSPQENTDSYAYQFDWDYYFSHTTDSKATPVLFGTYFRRVSYYLQINEKLETYRTAWNDPERFETAREELLSIRFALSELFNTQYQVYLTSLYKDLPSIFSDERLKTRPDQFLFRLGFHIICFSLWTLEADFLYQNTHVVMDLLSLLSKYLPLMQKSLRKDELLPFFRMFHTDFIEFLCHSSSITRTKESTNLFDHIADAQDDSQLPSFPSTAKEEFSVKMLWKIEFRLLYPLILELSGFVPSYFKKTGYSNLYEVSKPGDGYYNKKHILIHSYSIDSSQQEKLLLKMIVDYPEPLVWHCIVTNQNDSLLEIYLRIHPTDSLKKVSAAVSLHDMIGQDKSFEYEVETSADATAIIQQIRIHFETSRFAGATIVGLWYESLYDRRIPSRALTFTDEIEIREENHVIYFSEKNPVEPRPLSFFYHPKAKKQSQGVNTDQEPNHINNITAIVGKNGTGKTTAFHIMCQDSPDAREMSLKEKYIIFYKIFDRYCYSTNIEDQSYRISGIDSLMDRSRHKDKNSIVISYGFPHSMNWNGQPEIINGVNLSDNYIYTNEYTSSHINRFWDTARKLQFLQDIDLDEFYDRFGFVPEDCYIQFPDYMRDRDVSAEAIALMDAFSPDSSDELYRLNLQITRQTLNKQGIATWKAGTAAALSLYRMLRRNYGLLELEKQDYEKAAASEEYMNPDEKVKFVLPHLSSGQYAILDFFGRLHSFFLSQLSDRRKDDFNCFHTGSNIRNYILFLDEIELYMHPEWQRCFIDNLIWFLEWEEKRYGSNSLIENIQIILSSNSPFFMSDLPKENICMLHSTTQDSQPETDTFLQNIHALMKHSFFMEHGLAGQFAKTKVEWAINLLRDAEGNAEAMEELIANKAEISYIIHHVGEPVIRHTMEHLYENRFPKPVESPVQQSWTTEELSQILPPEVFARIAEQLQKKG